MKADSENNLILKKDLLPTLEEVYAPINVNPVGGGGVRARGGDLTKEQKFWSISQGWGSIRSPNVVKNPHPGAKYQIKDKLCTYL